VQSLLGWPAILLMLLAGATARAADLPGPWVEMASDGGLDVRSVIASGMDCPKVVADGTALTSDRRGKADGDYPVQTCIAHAAASSRVITVDGLAAPALPSDIKRIVVIGDTGCRLEGNFTQDCNDPVKWPFATVARLAAARRPDLVIHVGDYYYRETACPDTKPGCAGSPYGAIGPSGRRTSSIPPRRCLPRRRGSWCAATTKYAAVAAMAGSVCSIRIRAPTDAWTPRRPTPCASVR
jgi:hypothetical protein